LAAIEDAWGVGICQIPNCLSDPLRDLGWVFVLPESEHRPSRRAECGVHSFVARAVAGCLRSPEVSVALGYGVVLRAPVPKATVDEHRHPRAGEHQISAQASLIW